MKGTVPTHLAFDLKCQQHSLHARLWLPLPSPTSSILSATQGAGAAIIPTHVTDSETESRQVKWFAQRFRNQVCLPQNLCLSYIERTQFTLTQLPSRLPRPLGWWEGL